MKSTDTIQRLADMIDEAEQSFSKAYDLFGSGDWMTQARHARLLALQDAFKVVSGVSYFEWWTKQNIQEELPCAI